MINETFLFLFTKEMLFSFYHLEQGCVMDVLGHLSQLRGVETANLYFRTSFQVDLTAVQV